jgi:uncharacterized protein
VKILLLADEESKYLYDFFDKSKLEGIDLIISCGDLSPNYLSFLATFSSVPILNTLCTTAMPAAFAESFRNWK